MKKIIGKFKEKARSVQAMLRKNMKNTKIMRWHKRE